MIISSMTILDGTEINLKQQRYWALSDDFVFASSNSESEVGTLIHGGDGFDDLSGETMLTLYI